MPLFGMNCCCQECNCDSPVEYLYEPDGGIHLENRDPPGTYPNLTAILAELDAAMQEPAILEYSETRSTPTYCVWFYRHFSTVSDYPGHYFEVNLYRFRNGDPGWHLNIIMGGETHTGPPHFTSDQEGECTGAASVVVNLESGGADKNIWTVTDKAHFTIDPGSTATVTPL